MNKISNDNLENIQRILENHTTSALMYMHREIHSNPLTKANNEDFLAMINEEMEKRKKRIDGILDDNK